MNDGDLELAQGSGNVFRDVGDPDADLKQAKAILAARIIAVPDDRGLSVRKAGALTRFAAADFSRIRNADLGQFTLDRLMKMLAALDGTLRVTLQIDARPEGQVPMATQGGRGLAPPPPPATASVARGLGPAATIVGKP